MIDGSESEKSLINEVHNKSCKLGPTLRIIGHDQLIPPKALCDGAPFAPRRVYNFERTRAVLRIHDLVNTCSQGSGKPIENRAARERKGRLAPRCWPVPKTVNNNNILLDRMTGTKSTKCLVRRSVKTLTPGDHPPPRETSGHWLTPPQGLPTGTRLCRFEDCAPPILPPAHLIAT